VTDATFRGKWLLLYFGYANCPDICPTTLNDIAETLARLGPAADRVQPLFITIDPERDTPAAIGAYVNNFDPRIIGLTGTPAQVAVAAKAYRVYYRKEPPADAADGYLMQHSAFIYVVGPDGRYVTLFSPLQGQGPEQMAARLRELLSQGS
jgi:protein SCO1/2